MADLVANSAKGRVAELYNRVDLGDPAAARLYVIPIDAGAATDAALRDANTLADVITAGATERTTGGWNRKTLDGTALTALTVDDANDRMPCDIGDQTWTSVTAGAVTDLLIFYASVGSPTNSQLELLTVHDFPITPDGSDVVATVADFYRAS